MGDEEAEDDECIIYESNVTSVSSSVSKLLALFWIVDVPCFCCLLSASTLGEADGSDWLM